MSRPALLALLLLVLAGLRLPVLAQETSVTLKICNAGAVALDVYVSLSGKTSNTRVGPADCAVAAQTKGAMGAAQLGIAFADAKGHWGAPVRLDFLPDFGEGVARRGSESVQVRHGGASVSLPMQIRFEPPVPQCHTTQGSDGGPPIIVGASRAYTKAAEEQRRHAAPSSTYCDTPVYTINAIAYVDSHEMSFLKYCDVCDRKVEANKTPAQRAEEKRTDALTDQTIRGMEATSPLGALVMGNAVKMANKAANDETLERQQELAPVQRVNWKDMGAYVGAAFREDSRQPPVNKHIVVRGTVAGVVLPKPNALSKMVNVYFAESPEHVFGVCTTRPELFRETFGENFSQKMIGKTLEVEGQESKDECDSSTGGIRIMLARQLVPGTFSTAKTWTPPPPDAPRTEARAAAYVAPVNTDDARMPNYVLPLGTAQQWIKISCTGIYDPAGSLLSPEQKRIHDTNSKAVQADVQSCMASLDAHEAAAHRRIAMGFCLTKSTDSYDDCMNQNDTIVASCTRELRFRLALQHKAEAGTAKCKAPQPTPGEELVIQQGGRDERGEKIAVPASGPGLPAVLTQAMVPGVIAGGGTSSLTPVSSQTAAAPTAASRNAMPQASHSATPAVQPVNAGARQVPRPPPMTREQQLAERQRFAQKYAACQKQAMAAYPNDRAAMAKAYAACVQAP